MATSLNSMLGDFRGSVNGVCGSRNTAKAYIRARVKPTNPKSDAQKAARAAFRSAGKYFKTLSDTQRAQWQGFALDGYNPLKKSNTGQYTAAQVLTESWRALTVRMFFSKLPLLLLLEPRVRF